jgi:hypothetical protein
MMGTSELTTAVATPARSIRRPPLVAVVARLRSPWIDRRIAQGAPSWRSPTYAARSLQLTGLRYRRVLARSLERLIEDAERPRDRFSAVVPPCREQVREAMPAMLALASRLRSSEPVDARGVAQLTSLLCDTAGPCYMRARPGALAVALEAIDRTLEVPG